MTLQPAKGLPAYKVPEGIRKKSFAKKRKKKWWKVPEDISEIYKK